MDDFHAFQDTVSHALVATTRTATQLCAEDLGFHRSLDAAVASALDRQNARLLSLAERLLGSAAAASEVVRPKLPDADAVDARWKGVVDVVDSLLERADTSLDEYTGIVKRLTPSKEQSPAPQPRSTRPANNFRTQDLPKPQALFEHVPLNNEVDRWRPLLTSKPHATVSLEDDFGARKDEDGAVRYRHPYQAEIENYQYPPAVYTKADPIPYPPFESTTATLVDTPEALQAMLAELKTAKEIAIDLEHHDTRTYIGIVSLMQISTRNKDWIVDTLKPWRRRLECLNEVFADPSILKVLHGAHMDAIWLQRDLGLYLVGLFDTHHASRALGYAGGSLAFLLQKFINFTAQKQYQTADWRIRPLPQELFDYARSDTHFLLYIYDNMRNELIEKSDFSNAEEDRVRRVLEKSKETALQTYEDPVYDAKEGSGPMGWYRALYRNPNAFNKEQFAVFKAVHQWRDTVARQEDESVHYVMANHALFSVARSMPVDKPSLFNVAQPISPLVRLRADELVGTIARAKEAGTDGPEMWEVFGASTKAPVMPPSTSVGISTAFKALANPVVGDAGLIRSDTSSFWGGAFPSSIWQQRRYAAMENICLAVPLPQLTAEVFADPGSASAVDRKEKAVDPGARAEHEYVKPEKRPAQKEDDGIFIVKQLGGRKRKLADLATTETAASSASSQAATPRSSGVDADAEEAEELSVPDVEKVEVEQKTATKSQRRAGKRAAKKAKAAAAAQQQQQQQQQQQLQANGLSAAEEPEEEEAGKEEEQPFDYASAPSVLTTNQQRPKGKRDKKKKEFNPYAKAMDAPKGLGRVQRERAGKMGTFKK